MSKIAWFQLSKLPSGDLLDTFCREIKGKISGSDEVVFFITGATTPDEIDQFIKKLKHKAVNKDSFFISLGREHIGSGTNEKDIENIPNLEIKRIFDAYSRGQYGIDKKFSAQIRESHKEKYVEQWKSFFPQSDLHHEETIHYYRCRDSVFVLHINTTVLNNDLGYYIVDVDSLNKLMTSERSKTSRFRIAFGRSALAYLHPKEEQDRFLDSFIKNPDWLFYLCNNNSGSGCVRRYPKERSLTAPKDYFYEITLSASETQYIVGYYDTQKDIGKAELFIYNKNFSGWVRDANFAIGYNEAKGGTLYYPNFNCNIIQKCIWDEIGEIVKEFKNCASNEPLHIRYLPLNSHESFRFYIDCLLAIIEDAIYSFNPGSWEVLKVPATDNEDDFNRYPAIVRDSTSRLFVLCCSFDPEYNEITFKKQIDRLQQRYPSLCIFVLVLYIGNTGRTLPPEHGTVPFHFSNDFELVVQLAISMLVNRYCQNQLKLPGYMKNLLVFTNLSLQDFRHIPENEQNTSTIQEQKTNGGDGFDK